MHGQWLGKIDGEIEGSLRLEIEDRGAVFYGHAYLFYDGELPGFSFEIKLPKVSPYVTEVTTVYLYRDGGTMSFVDRTNSEKDLIARFGELPVPPKIRIDFHQIDNGLVIKWSADSNEGGSVQLVRSEIESPSDLIARPDLTSWDKFREWAIQQSPRNYIFRGQSLPHKLSSKFHRTWRKDIHTWIANDVRMLFGIIVERVSYPLQLGNLEHNAAIWSILQHHGYPTPMLDWTFSPFVAAYFAFQNAELQQRASPRIYIFDQVAWNERYGRQAFIVDAAPPQLVVLESLALGNPRSGPQQALSTVVNITDVEGFIRGREKEDGRVYLTVCDLTAQDKPRIMRELELMGITYGSLFPGLDGVCRDMSDRLFAPPT